MNNQASWDLYNQTDLYNLYASLADDMECKGIATFARNKAVELRKMFEKNPSGYDMTSDVVIACLPVVLKGAVDSKTDGTAKTAKTDKNEEPSVSAPQPELRPDQTINAETLARLRREHDAQQEQVMRDAKPFFDKMRADAKRNIREGNVAPMGNQPSFQKDM